MSLRRKIALWLCPELGGAVTEPAIPFPHAQHMGIGIHRCERIIPPADNKSLCEALKASQHASDAAWKAEVLEQLRAVNATLNRVVEGGSTMVVNGVQKPL